ncbi:DMT family transporter [Rhodospirillales bacterium]|nr:DMT family transporter [Rhodospirillales bacterium]
MVTPTTSPVHLPLRGALLMFIAAALVAATSMLAKILGNELAGDPLHPLQISAGRFVFAFMALCIVAPAMKLRFENTPWRDHFLRSLAGWLGVSWMFAAATQMPLAEATAISFLNPCPNQTRRYSTVYSYPRGGCLTASLLP